MMIMFSLLDYPDILMQIKFAIENRVLQALAADHLQITYS